MIIIAILIDITRCIKIKWKISSLIDLATINCFLWHLRIFPQQSINRHWVFQPKYQFARGKWRLARLEAKREFECQKSGLLPQRGKPAPLALTYLGEGLPTCEGEEWRTLTASVKWQGLNWQGYGTEAVIPRCICHKITTSISINCINWIAI